jgi:hypothetical protein
MSTEPETQWDFSGDLRVCWLEGVDLLVCDSLRAFLDSLATDTETTETEGKEQQQ